MSTGDGVKAGEKQSGPSKQYWPDKVQIFDGYYELMQNGMVVGKLLVKPGESTGASTEYWGLYGNYRQPSDTNTLESITFAYQGPHGGWSPLEFRRALPSGTTFITATCLQETI